MSAAGPKRTLQSATKFRFLGESRRRALSVHALGLRCESLRPRLVERALYKVGRGSIFDVLGQGHAVPNSLNIGPRRSAAPERGFGIGKSSADGDALKGVAHEKRHHHEPETEHEFRMHSTRSPLRKCGSPVLDIAVTLVTHGACLFSASDARAHQPNRRLEGVRQLTPCANL